MLMTVGRLVGSAARQADATVVGGNAWSRAWCDELGEIHGEAAGGSCDSAVSDASMSHLEATRWQVQYVRACVIGGRMQPEGSEVIVSLLRQRWSHARTLLGAAVSPPPACDLV